MKKMDKLYKSLLYYMIQYEQQTVIKRTMQKGYNAIVNKKRYNQILELLNDQIKDDTLVHIIDKRIKEILNFDPAKTAYNPEYGKNQAEKRKERALKEGKSVYELYRKPYLKKDNKNKIENEQDKVSVYL